MDSGKVGRRPRYLIAGKGSTAAFVDSLVRNTRAKTGIIEKPFVGLYTSPHLVEVRERIRIDGKPIGKEQFTQYFWDVWNRLEENPSRKTPEMTPLRPVYFRFLTILAFHIFKSLWIKPSRLNDEHIFESAEPCSYTSNIGPLLKICK